MRTCNSRISELRANLQQTRAETDSLMAEALRLCRRVQRSIDVSQVSINVGDVQEQLNRSYPRQ